MTVELLLLSLLFASAGLLLLQMILQLGLRIDAGFVFGFCFFFDGFGFLIAKAVPGSPLMALLAFPMLLALIAALDRPDRTIGLHRNIGIWLWFVFLFYCVMSLGWAYNSDYGTEKVQILFVRGVIPGIAIYYLYRKYKSFNWTFAALFGIAFSAIHQLFGDYFKEFPGRLTLPGGNPIYEAQLGLATAMIGLWGKGVPVVVRLAAIGLGLTAALSTQSRGPLLAFLIGNAVAAALVAYRMRKQGKLRIRANAVIASLFVLILLAATFLQFKDAMLATIGDSRFNIFVSSEQLRGDANFVGREHLMGLAIDKFVAHPFFGTGLGGNDLMGNLRYPHNLLLEIASELGVVGVALWAIAFLYSCYAAKRNLLLFALIAQLFVSTLFSGNFGYNFLYLLVAITALAFMPAHEGKEERQVVQNHVPNYRLRLRRGGNASQAPRRQSLPKRLASPGRFHAGAQSVRR